MSERAVDLSPPVARPARTALRGPEAEPSRMPLRAKGLLAMLAVVTLALLLVAATLLFRGVVEGDLAAFEQAQQTGQGLDLDRAHHLADARRHIDAGTVTIACLAWLGITTIGALSLLFFSRMAHDIGRLRTRALAIVCGDRSRGRTLSRNDELSDLAQALDSLAEALARHERDLEIERRHVMHQEKLAAIGSMAAGVLREIGNPIAAIDGHARAMQEAYEGGGCGACDPAPILRETARLGAITHEIAELAAPPAPHPQLASLNDIVTHAIGLLRYEPRLEAVVLVAMLDPQLPAVMVAADRLVQLLINLIINAADATAGMAPRAGRIQVTTRSAHEGVEVIVSDNGCGMTDAVRERVFEPFFTTKPAGRGTGLGLPLCRSIAQDHGGQITIDSTPGQGTRVGLWLPG